MNSKAKGNRVERALRDVFRQAGFLEARRTQQYSGNTGDAADVTVPELPWLHLESKGTEKKDFLNWFDQAVRDAAPKQKMPVVCHKRKGYPWIAILPLSEFITLIKER